MFWQITTRTECSGPALFRYLKIKKKRFFIRTLSLLYFRYWISNWKKLYWSSLNNSKWMQMTSYRKFLFCHLCLKKTTTTSNIVHLARVLLSLHTTTFNNNNNWNLQLQRWADNFRAMFLQLTKCYNNNSRTTNIWRN